MQILGLPNELIELIALRIDAADLRAFAHCNLRFALIARARYRLFKKINAGSNPIKVLLTILRDRKIALYVEDLEVLMDHDWSRMRPVILEDADHALIERAIDESPYIKDKRRGFEELRRPLCGNDKQMVQWFDCLSLLIPLLIDLKRLSIRWITNDESHDYRVTPESTTFVDVMTAIAKRAKDAGTLRRLTQVRLGLHNYYFMAPIVALPSVRVFELDKEYCNVYVQPPFRWPEALPKSQVQAMLLRGRSNFADCHVPVCWALGMQGPCAILHDWGGQAQSPELQPGNAWQAIVLPTRGAPHSEWIRRAGHIESGGKMSCCNPWNAATRIQNGLPSHSKLVGNELGALLSWSFAVMDQPVPEVCKRFEGKHRWERNGFEEDAPNILTNPHDGFLDVYNEAAGLTPDFTDPKNRPFEYLGDTYLT